jgi:hypothetical protein
MATPNRASSSSGKYLPADLGVLAAGMLCLFLFSQWTQSLSLQLSWCAALALTVPQTLNLRKGLSIVLVTQLSLFIFLAVPLWGFGSLHPLGFIYNILLGPIIGGLLLPLALLTYAGSFFGEIFDFVFQCFQWLMMTAGEPIVLPQGEMAGSGTIWWWIGFLHLTLWALRMFFRRGRDFSR